MNNEKYLVLGSNSFSGSSFIDILLSHNHKVMGISRSPELNSVFLPYKWLDRDNFIKKESIRNFNFKQLDLNLDLNKLIEIIYEFKPTYIVNFAAQGMVAESWKKPIDWYKTNLISQIALHDELRKMKFIKRYIHFTTPEVYGSTDDGWISENFNFAPSTPYAVSRASCDLHLMSFYKAYNFPVIFTRAANVYGEGQQLYRIIPRTMLSVLTKKPIYLDGGGNSERSFIHIKDVSSALLKIIDNAKIGTSWHISTTQKISIKNLVIKICQQNNVQFEDIVQISEERLGKDQSYLLDSSSLRNNFNWHDNIKLEKGLKMTMNWVKKNINKLVKLPWTYKHKS